jgi:hypothetical protein
MARPLASRKTFAVVVPMIGVVTLIASVLLATSPSTRRPR